MTDVSITTASGVCRIELNRPQCGNLVTMDMVKALTLALHSIQADVKLAAITGNGKDFCKGRDYQTAPESAGAGKATPSALKIREEMTAPMMSLYTTLRDSPVATLSVVQGAAYGFGCALAGACDMTLAGESARFCLPEMSRGLPPTLAMSALWDRISPRAIGYMVYSTAELNARDAFTLGLAHAVVADTELDSRAGALIETVSSQPLDAIRTVKEYLREAPSMPAAARSGYGASLFAAVLSSR